MPQNDLELSGRDVLLFINKRLFIEPAVHSAGKPRASIILFVFHYLSLSWDLGLRF